MNDIWKHTRPKVHKSKKVYSRKDKHKKNYLGEDEKYEVDDEGVNSAKKEFYGEPIGTNYGASGNSNNLYTFDIDILDNVVGTDSGANVRRPESIVRCNSKYGLEEGVPAKGSMGFPVNLYTGSSEDPETEYNPSAGDSNNKSEILNQDDINKNISDLEAQINNLNSDTNINPKLKDAQMKVLQISLDDMKKRLEKLNG